MLCTRSVEKDPRLSALRLIIRLRIIRVYSDDNLSLFLSFRLHWKERNRTWPSVLLAIFLTPAGGSHVEKNQESLGIP
jgi:hypothetical protein